MRRSAALNFGFLLDPNKDAFGRQKNGFRTVKLRLSLTMPGITVRWCNTQGEQCHSKMILKRHAQEAELILGSANFYRTEFEEL